jgi:hypothetical protein
MEMRRIATRACVVRFFQDMPTRVGLTGGLALAPKHKIIVAHPFLWPKGDKKERTGGIVE